MSADDERTAASARNRGRLLSLASAAAMGVTYVGSKYALRTMHPETFVVFWFAMGACYALLSLGRRRRMHRILATGHPWKGIAAIGLASAASILLLFHALKLIDPALVSFYTRADNLFAVLLGVALLRERLTPLEGVGALVAFTGSLIIAFRSGHVVLLALGLCLMSSLLQGVVVVLAKMAVRRAGPLVITFYRSLIAALAALVCGLVTGRLEMPSGTTLLVIAGASLAGSFLANVAFYASLVRIDVTEATAIKTSQPFFVILAAWFAFQTFPSPQQLFGGLLIVGGIVLLLFARRMRSGQRRSSILLHT